MPASEKKVISLSQENAFVWVNISSAWTRSRWAGHEISVRRGNFQLIWFEFCCCWKLGLWRDLFEINYPWSRDNFFHMNSLLFWWIMLVPLTAWKESIFGVILVRIFPHSDWIRRDIPYLSVFSPNVGKYGPE